jgi:hypothetical protein
MTSVPPLPNQPLPRLFLMPVDSQLQQFLIESHRVVEFAPQILDHMGADLREHGLEKKRLRQADRRCLEGQTPDLANMGIELRPGDSARMELEVGRPRLDPYLVYLFLMLRGRLGGCKDQYRTFTGSARLLQSTLSILCSARQACMATDGADPFQLKPAVPGFPPS